MNCLLLYHMLLLFHDYFRTNKYLWFESHFLLEYITSILVTIDCLKWHNKDILSVEIIILQIRYYLLVIYYKRLGFQLLGIYFVLVFELLRIVERLIATKHLFNYILTFVNVNSLCTLWIEYNWNFQSKIKTHCARNEKETKKWSRNRQMSDFKFTIYNFI